MAPVTLDWLHLAALLGAVQGLLLAGVLAARHRNRTANRLLAALMLAFSLHLATSVYHAGGFVADAPHFFGVAYPVPFLYGPLVWLYAVTAADRDRRLTRRDLLHLVPFAALVLAGLPIYLMSGAEKVALFHALERGERPLLLAVADPLKLLSGVAYAAATLLFLRRHRERVKESYSTTERVELRWLVRLGAAAAGIWLLAVAFRLLDAAGLASVQRGDDVVSLAIAALVYAIGYRGLRQPEIHRYDTAEYAVPARETTAATAAQPVEVPVEVPEPEATIATETGTTASRYERSGLTERQAQRLRDALLAVMERDRPWRDPELTLADLATKLSTTPHKLSEVLNAQVGQTFYDFVNGYRVREVQRRIAAGEARSIKMLSLAMDAGFASKSTFNAVFKKHTSLTPSDFRQAAGA